MSLYKNKHGTLTGVRPRRVAEQIQRIIAEALVRGDIHVPELEGIYVGIAHVTATPDLKQARVFLNIMPADTSVPKVLEALNKKAYAFQKLLGQQLQLKFTPILTFVEDTFLAGADKTQELFQNPRVQQDLSPTSPSSPSHPSSHTRPDHDPSDDA